MSMRRVSIIEEMFVDVASRHERLTVDELYGKGNKGSAIVFMLKRIRRQWHVFTGKTETQEIAPSPRVIRIVENGVTRFMAR